MQPDDQGSQGGRREVVQVVDGEEDAGFVGPGHPAHLLEDRPQVAGQVTRVRRSRDGVDLNVEGGPVREGERRRP